MSPWPSSKWAAVLKASRSPMRYSLISLGLAFCSVLLPALRCLARSAAFRIVGVRGRHGISRCR